MVGDGIVRWSVLQCGCRRDGVGVGEGGAGRAAAGGRFEAGEVEGFHFCRKF